MVTGCNANLCRSHVTLVGAIYRGAEATGDLQIVDARIHYTDGRTDAHESVLQWDR